jgi:parvulin-like peptidyl-prolyl isomerase
MRRRLLSVFLAAAIVVASGAFAADLPPDVLVKSRWMEITRADYDAAIARVPKRLRAEFTASPKRVQATLDNLLIVKTLAAQAKAHGTQPVEASPKGVGSEEERSLAAGELMRIRTDAEHAFDTQKSAFEQKAREDYELDRTKYMTPEEVRFSDIAIVTKDRGDAAALARAKEARAKIVAGEDFAKVAHEYSDDPTTRDKGGALPFVTRDRLEKPYADGVFALKRVGEISQPIKASTAYHIVRLDELHPARQMSFDEVRDKIMERLRNDYVHDQRELRLKAIATDDTIQVNQPVVDALVTELDPKLFEPKKKLPPSAAK